jgi:hypothetical protein
LNHVTSARPSTAEPCSGVIAVPTDDASRLAPALTRRWWRRLFPQRKVFGYAHNRYVISDYSQPRVFHSVNEVPPLRLVLVQGLIHSVITLLLIVSAVGIWRLG